MANTKENVSKKSLKLRYGYFMKPVTSPQLKKDQAETNRRLTTEQKAYVTLASLASTKQIRLVESADAVKIKNIDVILDKPLILKDTLEIINGEPTIMVRRWAYTERVFVRMLPELVKAQYR